VRTNVEHALFLDRLVDEGAGARLFHEPMRRVLNVGRHYDDARRGVHLPELRQHVESIHPLHDQIEQNEIRLLEEVPLERQHTVLRFDDFEPAGFENASHAPSRQRRIVHKEEFLFHRYPRIASAIPSSEIDRSLKPASSIDRGIP
jgi:hypothetical protein